MRKLAQRLARVDHGYEDVDIIRVYIYHGALWWNFLHSTHQSKCTDPWWSQWSFDPLDWALGRTDRIDEPQGDEIVELGFPEGTYRCRIKTSTTTIRRPRWPWVWGEPFTTYDAKPVGENDDIPIPGKGENAWDCGPDSISGQCGPGGLTEAIGSIYASILRTRLQRCGSAECAERPRPRTPDPAPEPEQPEAVAEAS